LFSDSNMPFWFHVPFNSRFSHVLDVKIFQANFTSCLTTQNWGLLNQASWNAHFPGIVRFYIYEVKWSERSKKTETKALLLCMTAHTYVPCDWTCGIERIGLVHSKWLTNLHKCHARMQCKRMLVSRYLGMCTCVYFYWN